MTTALEILTAARELISKPEHWTKGAYARDRLGHIVDEDDHCASCFCSAGAILIAAGGRWDSVTSKVFLTLADHTDKLSVPDFNDTHTHAEVLALFDAAIAAEREKAGAK